MITESGGVLAVEVIAAPRPLAPAFLFAENNSFPVDVIALRTVRSGAYTQGIGYAPTSYQRKVFAKLHGV